MREMCGLSQQDVSDDLAVNIKTVKRWEREDLPQFTVPAHAMDYVTARLEEFMRDIEATMSLFELAEDDAESALENAELDAAQLVYYRNQEQLQAAGCETRRVGQVNAATRAAAAILLDMGVDVSFCYPEGEDRIAPR